MRFTRHHSRGRALALVTLGWLALHALLTSSATLGDPNETLTHLRAWV